MSPETLREETIAAHGGRALWQSVAAVECALSSAGFAFAMHCQPSALLGLRVQVWPHVREVLLRDYVHPGWTGHWTPEYVAIHDQDGRLVSERHHPRHQFSRFIKNLIWDKLDILYFAGYALWNYLSFPYVLTEPGVSVGAPLTSMANAHPQMMEHPRRACSTLTRDAGTGLRLVGQFPDSVPTHSARQLFHLDENRWLTRHDYTADVIGRWATAANCVLASEVVGGLRFYTRRKVYPRMGPRQTVLPFPLLVNIEIDDLAVRFAEAAA